MPSNESLCINPTNTNLLWLQLSARPRKILVACWGKQNPIGLLQRCLISFCTQKHRLYPQHIHVSSGGYLHRWCGKVFTNILQNMGPKTPKAVGHSLEVSPEQTQAKITSKIVLLSESISGLHYKMAGVQFLGAGKLLLEGLETLLFLRPTLSWGTRLFLVDTTESCLYPKKSRASLLPKKANQKQSQLSRNSPMPPSSKKVGINLRVDFILNARGVLCNSLVISLDGTKPRWTTLRWTAQNIARCFPSPGQNFVFFPLCGSYRSRLSRELLTCIF